MESKSCNKCGLVKPLDQFSKSSSGKFGRKSRCKSCISEDKRAYRAANLDACRAKDRERRALDGGVNNARSRAWYAANKDKAKQTRRAWRERNAEKDRADVAAYQKANAERLKAAAKIWSANNRDKKLGYAKKYRDTNREQFLLAGAEWRKRNRHKVNAKKSRRIASQVRATPGWADLEKISAVYFAANFLSMVTGEWYHVDHIVPIRSDVVCGLHWEGNLRVLPSAENQSKGNRHWPDMP